MLDVWRLSSKTRKDTSNDQIRDDWKQLRNQPSPHAHSPPLLTPPLHTSSLVALYYHYASREDREQFNSFFIFSSPLPDRAAQCPHSVLFVSCSVGRDFAVSPLSPQSAFVPFPTFNVRCSARDAARSTLFPNLTTLPSNMRRQPRCGATPQNFTIILRRTCLLGQTRRADGE